MDIALEVLALLFVVAVFAGFVDAVAGGGGLLTLPALFFAGVPPIAALATNKLQGSFASMAATIHFSRRRIVDIGTIKWMVIAVFFASASGSYLVQLVDNQFLLAFMPIGLIAIALYSFFNKELGQKSEQAKLTDKQFSISAAPAVGFYDGFFGPGTGTFFAISLVRLKGMDFVRATGHAKALNFTSNIASLLVFVLSGQVVWVIGLVMAAGAFTGGRIGAATVISKGAGFVRALTVIVCIAISISLLAKQYG